MQWFRLYTETLNDPKVQLLDGETFKAWINLLCVANQCAGKIIISDAWFHLRCTQEQAILYINKLIVNNLFHEESGIITPHAWNERQYLSDNSNIRVKKYRDKRKSMGLTSNGYIKHSVTVTSRDNNCCVYCGAQNNLCIDHILPNIMGGTDHIDNLVIACKACNSGKAGRTPEQAGYSFINKEAELRWKAYSKCVTVTVTPPEQNRTDAEQNKKEQREALPDFKNLELSEEGIVYAKENGIISEHLLKSWKKFKIHWEDHPPENWFKAWKKWILDEKRPIGIKSIEKALVGKELDIQRLGSANWRRKRNMSLNPDQIRMLEIWEKEKGIVTWTGIGDYEKKYGKICQ